MEQESHIIEKQSEHIQRKSGHWFVLAASVLWGTTGTAQAFAPEGAQPATIGAIRLVIGGGVMLIFALGRGALRTQRPWPVLPAIIAAWGVVAYQLCFFSAVARTGVAERPEPSCYVVLDDPSPGTPLSRKRPEWLC